MRQPLSKLSLLLLTTALAASLAAARFSPAAAAPQEGAGSAGSLQALDAKGQSRGLCPLKHTAVKAEVSGFLSRVRVTQEFENPFAEKIEAVYTFPLPQAAAVDDMTMTVGDRTVRGRILKREEAEAVYEAAKAGGQVASLLDQERPNVFTQSVANIMPGEKVTVTISYVETLRYEDGAYEFVFPMVVGPRYVPGVANGAGGTDKVPDAARVRPPLTPKGTRAGHDVSLEVALDAGVPLDDLKSKSHEIEVKRPNGWSARVRLKNRAEIPNRDFVLRYDVAGGRISDALLAHRADRGGFFTFILQPPERVTVQDVTPKEIVFVLDTSGSMSGFPIEKAKEAMKLALDGLNPRDTFNLITFAGDTHVLFPRPVPATAGNLGRAREFLASRKGEGGTEMMQAIKAALAPSDARDHIRVVCFMTDGHVGNDLEIVAEVQKHPRARIFAFGIGSSVNRFLLDKIAEEGRGEVEYVGLSDDGSLAARRFHERVREPLLTDIEVDWASLPVADVYPKRVPDLFSAKPVVLSGRYTKGGRGVLRLRGKMSGRDFAREIPVELPEAEARNDVLATLWARTRVADLVRQDYAGLQQDKAHSDLRETITQLGLEYRLMTKFTSFVAVEEMIVNEGGVPRRVEVPVELPDGTARGDESSGGVNVSANLGYILNSSPTALGQQPQFLSNQQPAATLTITSTLSSPPPPPPKPTPLPTYKRTISGGVLNGKAVSLPLPAYPAAAKSASASGQVTVLVTVDESGNVVSTKTATGHPLLQAAAREAAGRAKFTPTKLSGKPVRVTGFVTYNFASPGAKPIVNAAVRALAPPEPSPEQKRRAELETKLHRSLVAVVDRLKEKGAKPGADEARFVRDGRAEIHVWLTDKSEEAIAQLRQLGFEVVLDPKTAKLVIGRLPVEKLEALAALTFVRYVAPQLSESGRR